MAVTINVFYVRTSSILEELWDDYMSLIPVQLQMKIEGYLFWKDRQARLLSKLLLAELLSKESPGLLLSDVKYHEFKKPYIEGNLSFNISHSGDYVVCAFVKNNKPLGIDLEQIDPQIKVDDFKRVFSSYEWAYIQSSTEPVISFYNLWTIKESAVKADGRGLIIPLDNVRVQNDFIQIDEKKWYYKEVEIANGYRCHLTLDNPEYTIEAQEISIFDLYNNLVSKRHNATSDIIE